MDLVYGIITGIVFGYLLQKAFVLRYDKQVGALRFLDMTIFKFMLSAIVVATAGLYLCHDMGLIELKLKATSVGAQLVGGGLFGIGWGLLGYCPGTAGGALAEGRIDGLWGILGMLFGGGLYGRLYPLAKTHILPLGNYGKITLPQVLNLNHWMVIVAFAVITGLFFLLFEKKNL